MIVCIGDSITAGQYLDTDERSWPKLLQHFDVEDAGVSDDTTRLGLERFPRDVQRRNPDAVVIQFGTNDANRWLSDRGLPRVSERAYRANLVEMVERCRTFGAEPFLVTIIPTDKSPQLAEDVGRYDQALRQVAIGTRTRLIDVRSAWEPGLLMDGVHPTQEGHRLYAGVVQTVLDEWARGHFWVPDSVSLHTGVR